MDQLKMIRDDSPVVMPDTPPGYYMRAYQQGDEEDCCRCCINGALGVNEISVSQFERIMVEDECVDTSNIYFLCHESGGVVGTVTYQYGKESGEGYIHMVAIAPDHIGKGLALYMNLYVIDKILKADNKTVVLTTDDCRLPAIKTYLKCGFTPCVSKGDIEMEERWNEVFEKLKER